MLGNLYDLFKEDADVTLKIGELLYQLILSKRIDNYLLIKLEEKGGMTLYKRILAEVKEDNIETLRILIKITWLLIENADNSKEQMLIEITFMLIAKTSNHIELSHFALQLVSHYLS